MFGYLIIHTKNEFIFKVGLIMENSKQLIWSPIHEYIKKQIHERNELRLLIAPFVKLTALQELLKNCGDVSNLKVIVRWSGRDILNQVSDLEVYPYLSKKRIPLYIHPSIHLKLYVFNGVWAFHTSGNITQKGLGIVVNHNIEVGCMVRLQSKDWKHIFRLLEESYRVDENVYEKALEYFRNNKCKVEEAPPLPLPLPFDKHFSILSLPATESPEVLYSYYQDLEHEWDKEDRVAACVHDLILYEIPDGLDEKQFFILLKNNFTSHPFVREIVLLIRKEKSARFGLVNEWLQKQCSDKPTPYKWELKENTSHLYNWLAYFFEEISWDRPHYSMILRWNN